MSYFEDLRGSEYSCAAAAGDNLWDDLLNTPEGGTMSPLSIGGAFLNCVVRGGSLILVAEGSAALLDRMLEKDIGFEAFVSSCTVG